MKPNNFESFSKTSAGRCSATFSRKFSTIPLKQLWDTVHSEVAWALPHLMEGGKYTTEHLIDPGIWSGWLTVEHRIAGMCLAYQVKVGAIPLKQRFTQSGKGTKRYRLPFVKAGAASLPTSLTAKESCSLANAFSFLNATPKDH